ncbi:MAG: hypothetical protein ABR568_17140 [Pyrinomonadaceae bacterium]
MFVIFSAISWIVFDFGACLGQTGEENGNWKTADVRNENTTLFLFFRAFFVKVRPRLLLLIKQGGMLAPPWARDEPGPSEVLRYSSMRSCGYSSRSLGRRVFPKGMGYEFTRGTFDLIA